MNRRHSLFASVLCLCSVLAGCGKSNALPWHPPTPTPSPASASTATASPTPTPAPGAVTLSQSSLNFIATGASYAQTATVAQANYGGAFTASTANCGGIATIAGSGASFTVTPVAAGSCSFTISGGGGRTATLSIGVTTTSVGGN